VHARLTLIQDDALGMTLDEFTEMMTQAETGFVLNGGSGGMPSLGGMLAKNMGKVMKYKSKDAEALALRNKVAHKKSKDVDALDDFLAKENAVVCARCHGKFDPADNKEGSCTYHRMAGKTDGSNVTNNNQKITYPVYTKILHFHPTGACSQRFICTPFTSL
jgi:hypothetical protein